MTNYQTIRLDVDEAVATLTLDRPDRMNAATPEMFDELRDACEKLKPAGVRAVIVTGNGRAFCAGADLGGRTFDDGTSGDASRRVLQKHYNPGLAAFEALDLPVIAAVNGAAVGIGAALAFSADLIIAARSAYFLQAFVNIGLVPDGGSTWSLPKSIGLPAAMEAMMLGDRISADRAEQLGMINRCVDDAVLQAEAKALARRLASGPTVAIGLIRQLARASQHMSVNEARHLEAEAQKRAADTEDFEEGLRAFAEKRKPEFKGK